MAGKKGKSVTLAFMADTELDADLIELINLGGRRNKSDYIRRCMRKYFNLPDEFAGSDRICYQTNQSSGEHQPTAQTAQTAQVSTDTNFEEKAEEQQPVQKIYCSPDMLRDDN